MLVDREIHASERVVALSVTGELSDEGLLSLPAELRSAPEVEPDFALLIDLRHVVCRDTVTTQAVLDLARVPLVLSPDSRRAVVVSSDFGFGMARMYQALRQEPPGSDMRVFRNPEKAWQWVICSPGPAGAT